MSKLAVKAVTLVGRSLRAPHGAGWAVVTLQASGDPEHNQYADLDPRNHPMGRTVRLHAEGGHDLCFDEVLSMAQYRGWDTTEYAAKLAEWVKRGVWA